MSDGALVLIGVAYHTASLAEREALALDRETARRLLARVAAAPGIRASACLTTCSRTELYLHADSRSAARRAATAAVREICGRALLTGRAAVRPGAPGSLPAFVRTGRSAVRHLLRVASGIDSPVLGDVQVLGQVKAAYATAREAGTTDAVINRLFETALRAGRRARRETGIGRGNTSAAAAAAALVARSAAPLSTRRVAVIGAGETAAIAARHLAKARPASLVILNRTLAHAETLAREVGGHARPLTALDAVLREADVVVSATSGPEPIVTAGLVVEVMRARPGRPLLAVDLAVPRDIEWQAGAVPGVRLYAIDEVQAEAAQQLTARAASVPDVERIVAGELARFAEWHAAHQAGHVIRVVRDRLARTLVRLAGERPAQPPVEDQRAARESRRRLGRLLHGPTVRLRALALRPGGRERLASLRARLAG
ncbi:MAG TPA: glutamyl-tRNA reductase [Vicinamibacterales bacterium]